MNNFNKDIEKMIDGVDVVSFDIFDTLIIRDFFYPTDIFKYVEYDTDLKDFQSKRIKAEILARSNNFNLSDITYELIYTELKELDPSLELDIELKSCIVNADIKKIYNYAIKSNKQVIAISDMYLDQHFLEKLLMKNGFDSIVKVFVSGNLNKTKGKGTIYKYIISELDVRAEKILHIGDNYHSDYLQAKEKGLQSYYYKALRERLVDTYNEYLLEGLKEHNTPQASLFAGLLSNTHSQKVQKEYWYQFGFEYAGILIFNFIHHVYSYCKSNKISRIYFMARDGKIMQKVFDILYGHDKDIKTYYMLASRRLFFVPSIKDIDSKTLESLVESQHGTPYIDIINRLGFEWLQHSAEEYFEDVYKPIVNQADREGLKHFFLLHKKKIMDEVLKEKTNLLRYLESIEFFDDDNKLIVDVGWGCTSQKYLESIIEDKVHAIYYGTHKETYSHDLTHGYIFNQGLPKKENDLILSSLPVVELLFVGNHYSIVKLDSNLNPVYHKESVEEEKRIGIARHIHEGISDFVSDYHRLLIKYQLLPDYSLDVLVLTSLLIKPSIQDIRYISKVPHAASFGESSYEPIIKNLNQTQLEFLKNILSGKMLDNSSLWPRGKGRYNQLLNKKHYKSIEFLSLFFTKLQHCYSYPFKVCLLKILRKLR